MSAAPSSRYQQRGLHAGYRYQDLIAALAACELLMRGSGRLAIESSRFDGDPFDDVVLVLDEERRVQVKHVEMRDPVDANVFVGNRARLPIDELVAGRSSSGEGIRVLSTWATPAPLPAWLRLVGGPGTFSVGSSVGLDAAVIWPAADEPIWHPLQGSSRAEFVAFSNEFVLELDLPSMSGTLAAPGPCEEKLLRSLRQVGVERHPNNRSAVDVAARLLEVTSSARGRRDRHFSFGELTHEIGLEIDRGHIPQAHPLDRGRYVEPVLSTSRLADVLRRYPRAVVVGEPGSGKSWSLEALARELPRDDWVVARHYCFLTPGDADVQARVAVETMAGNLLFELLEDSELRGLPVGLGGDLGDLEMALKAAASALRSGSQRNVALIVDGLDHVARVEVGPGQRRWRPDDFAEALTHLELPDEVSIIVGSQPGEHLTSFWDMGAEAVHVPPFDAAQVRAQLDRLGVFGVLGEQHLDDDAAALVLAVTAQAAGNPLYVTFLAEQVLAWLASGPLDLPSRLVAQTPTAAGDLKAYYEYLLSVDSDGVSGVVVEHLALIEFAVTLDDLDGILPSVGKRRLEAALTQLRPILAVVASQGGYRVYHESLRRHVASRLQVDGRSAAPILRAVINWLDRRGLYADARVFRHLLPLLRSAGDLQDVLDRLGPDFVGESVVHLQPAPAVAANIRLGAFVATELGDLPKLTALSELRRAAHTAYEEKLSDITTYAEACVELFGVDRLAQQLIYEERPVYDFDTGLELCAMVDRRGGTAPWTAYSDRGRAQAQGAGASSRDERFRRSLNHLRGQVRVAGRSQVMRRAAAFLLDNKKEPRPEYLVGLSETIEDVLGADALDELLDRAAEADPERLVAFRIRAAEAARASGDARRATSRAREAAMSPLTPTQLLRALRCGVAADELAARLPEPQSIADAVLAKDYTADLHAVQSLRVAVVTWFAASVDLDPLRRRFDGAGWYRRWLRFVVDTATSSSSAETVIALREVASDTAPFVGQPRACDLYAIRDETQASFAEALTLVSDEDMPEAIDAILAVSRGTTTYLQRSQSGPLPMWAALEILLPHASCIPLDVVARWIEDSWTREYYGLHAEAFLGLARLHCAAGDRPAAEKYWRRAGRYLAGYGMRKDVTLFAPLEALAAQPASSQVAVVERLTRLRRLADRAVYHSDGKETKHLPGAWMDVLAAVSPELAADVLARTLRRHPPVEDWVCEAALPEVVAAGQDYIPPLLGHALWRCTPARRHVEAWLRVVERLADEDPARGQEAFAELAAAADGDDEHLAPDAIRLLADCARARGWPHPSVGAVPDPRPAASGSRPTDSQVTPAMNVGPFLAGVNTLMALMAWARAFDLDSWEAPVSQPHLAAELEATISQASLAPDQLLAVIETLARRQLSLRRADVIAVLADARAENDPATAAELFVLAWCSGRGGGGWERFGGLDQRDLLERAAECDVVAATRRLAIEVAQVIDDDPYTLGMTRRMCEALVVLDQADLALRCIDAAVEVIEYRLPSTGSEPEIWTEPTARTGSAPEEFARLLAACLRHPDFDRRAASLGGLAELIASDVHLATTVARSIMHTDFSYVDVLAFWLLVRACGADGESVAQSVEEELLAANRAGGFGLRYVTGELLESLGLHRSGDIDPSIERLSISATDVDRVAACDAADRLAVLARGWHGIRRLVAERHAWLWSGQHDGIAADQADRQFSRGSPWVPPKPHHQWSAEIFECALHDALPEFRDRLVASGRWTDDTEQAVAALANPDAAAAAARGRSRIVRPQEIPLPENTVAGAHRVITLRGGVFAGWSVAGHWEHGIRALDHSSRGRLTRVYSGVAVSPWPLPTPPSLPFPWAESGFRWHDQNAPPEKAKSALSAGPLVACWVQHDALGWDRGLTLRADLRAALDLAPARLPAAFDLVDEKLSRCVVWRRWWMTPFSYDYGPTTPLLLGGALLLSPRVVTEVQRQSPAQMESHMTVEHIELSPRT